MKNLKAKLKKNKQLIAVISLPLVMMLVVALIVYVPSLFIKPTYDFIYYTCDGYCYSQNIDVKSGKVVETFKQNNYGYAVRPNDPSPVIYLYSVEDGESREITLEEAQKYELDDSYKSPDGFEITNGGGYSGGFILGGYYGDGDSVKKLQKGTASFDTDIDRYDYYFNFLGWVEK